MRKLVLAIMMVVSATAAAEPRKLTLAEAVQMAMRVDPTLAEAHISDDRARLGVLRAQLDRFSLTVNGTLQELWNKANIGGSYIPPQSAGCSDPKVPDFLCGQGLVANVDGTSRTISFPGMITTQPIDQTPSQWLGLSNFQAQLNYYLFSGLRVEANVKRAKLNEKAALVQIKQQRKDVALLVARAYWQVRRLAILRAVQEAALARMSDAEKVAEARVQAGLAPPIDKNRATQRKLTQLATLADLTGQARAAAAQLAVTLGTSDEIELVDEPTVPDVMPPSPTELVREALQRRPEIANAKLQVELQHQQVVMARSNFFPQLTLLGLFQYGNNQYNPGTGARQLLPTNPANPFSGLSGTLTLGATMTMNFFDTLNTYTTTGDMRYVEQLNRQEVRRFERLVDADVRAAHANLIKLYDRRVPLRAARDIARDNLRILEARYKNGDALIFEYLDAQVDLATAELNLADVTAQLQQQWLELGAALGFTVGAEHG
jgi:outer membrane protein TolC